MNHRPTVIPRPLKGVSLQFRHINWCSEILKLAMTSFLGIIQADVARSLLLIKKMTQKLIGARAMMKPLTSSLLVLLEVRPSTSGLVRWRRPPLLVQQLPPFLEYRLLLICNPEIHGGLQISIYLSYGPIPSLIIQHPLLRLLLLLS